MKPCIQQTHAERVTAMARMIWNREQYAPKREAGVCQFCGEILKHSYRVAKDGRLFTCEPNSESEKKALALIKNPEPWTFVFPISACEAMTGEAIQREADMLCNRWRADLQQRRESQGKPVAAKVDEEAYQSF